MSHLPQHRPAEWELARGQSVTSRQRQLALDDVKARSDADRLSDSGFWWDGQRRLDQVVPAQMVNPDTFDTFTYRYQLYARPPPIQCEPQSLAEVTDQQPPLGYNVKRMAIDKPLRFYQTFECGAHWERHPWTVAEGESKGQSAQDRGTNNNSSSPIRVSPDTKGKDTCPCSPASSTSRLPSDSTASLRSNGDHNQNANNGPLSNHGNCDEYTNMNTQSSSQSILQVPAATSSLFRTVSVKERATCNKKNRKNIKAAAGVIDQNANNLICVDSVSKQDQKIFTASFPPGACQVSISAQPIPKSRHSPLFNRNDNHWAPDVQPTSENRNYSICCRPIQECRRPGIVGQRMLCKPADPGQDIHFDAAMTFKKKKSKLALRHEEDNEEPLRCRVVAPCPGSRAARGSDERLQLLCEPTPRTGKPKPGYGTYKIIGGKQYHEPPEPDMLGQAKLPAHLQEYKDFTRICPDFHVGRYDRSDWANEMLLPGNRTATLLKSSRSPFMYCMNPRPRSRSRTPQDVSKGEGLKWSLPTFV